MKFIVTHDQNNQKSSMQDLLIKWIISSDYFCMPSFTYSSQESCWAIEVVYPTLKEVKNYKSVFFHVKILNIIGMFIMT